tara:strand:- start:1 stop:690 length:690 start_codon:yes stop_codon:yes gene_type:complete
MLKKHCFNLYNFIKKIFLILYAKLKIKITPSSITLDAYLLLNGVNTFSEGYTKQIVGQVSLIKDIINKNQITKVMEIGFHAGHSAELMLEFKEISLVSFDIDQYPYTKIGYKYIKSKYHSRHIMIRGDSTISIPNYIAENPGITFDLIFIDGGHEYEIVKTDIINCKKLAGRNTIVIVDDTVFSKVYDYSAGPTKVWEESIESKQIIEIGRKEFDDGRGMAWGKYNFFN